jgi:glyoxylase-like metal-dependent hydrolase (beta-lactamase superfamily II)
MRFLLFILAFAISLPADAAEIIRYTSGEKGFAVNSWLVPTDTGLIVIDTQFTNSEAQALVKAIANTGRPLKAIFITHPHPDHYNGTCELLKLAPVPVYATQSTIDGIHATQEAKRAQWKPVYGSDYPGITCGPDHAVPASGKLSIDGLDLEIQDYGAGEASGETIVFAPALRSAFVGDLIYNEVHPWLAEGRTGQWLTQLERLSGEFPIGWTVYPGHGAAGGAGVIVAQYNYILEFRDAIESKLGPAGLDANGVKDVQDLIRTRYPGWHLEMLIPMNTGAVTKELLEQTPGKTD